MAPSELLESTDGGVNLKLCFDLLLDGEPLYALVKEAANRFRPLDVRRGTKFFHNHATIADGDGAPTLFNLLKRGSRGLPDLNLSAQYRNVRPKTLTPLTVRLAAFLIPHPGVADRFPEGSTYKWCAWPLLFVLFWGRQMKLKMAATSRGQYLEFASAF
jgi:hypothetical protein